MRSATGTFGDLRSMTDRETDILRTTGYHASKVRTFVVQPLISNETLHRALLRQLEVHYVSPAVPDNWEIIVETVVGLAQAEVGSYLVIAITADSSFAAFV